MRSQTTVVQLRPRLASETVAAVYCAMSVRVFRRECPVRAINVGRESQPILRYDLNDLDDWINARKIGVVPSTAADWLERAGS